MIPGDAQAIAAPPPVEDWLGQLFRLALQRVPTEAEIARWRDAVGSPDGDLVALVSGLANGAEASALAASREREASELVQRIYGFLLGRTASAEEESYWLDLIVTRAFPITAIISAVERSEEAVQIRAAPAFSAGMTGGAFVQEAYEAVLLRGALPDEITYWDFQLSQGVLSRQALVSTLSRSIEAAAAESEAGPGNDPSRAPILGTDRSITLGEWNKALRDLRDPLAPVPDQPSVVSIRTRPARLVTVLASLYGGRDFIGPYLENMTSQTIFRDAVELVIVDAASPDEEYDVIRPYLREFSNIRYHRLPSRVGIYEAWNVGILESTGEYVTNANLDDPRRRDSLEIQAATLDAVSSADIVYQDFFYTFDPKLDFETIARVGIKSELPLVTPYNLLKFNSPHNAPMWRRTLHTDIGLFEARYQSAGDWDFWLRCAIAGKNFHKINDPHVAYYVNPTGLSTRETTLGPIETSRITRQIAKTVVSGHLVSSPEAFANEVARRAGAPTPACEPAVDWRYETVQKALEDLSRRFAERRSRRGR